MCPVFFVQNSDCWKLYSLVIISTHSTAEVTGLVPGVQNVTSWTRSSNVVAVAYFSTRAEPFNEDCLTRPAYVCMYWKWCFGKTIFKSHSKFGVWTTHVYISFQALTDSIDQLMFCCWVSANNLDELSDVSEKVPPKCRTARLLRCAETQ
jgi:hypothetical protein